MCDALVFDVCVALTHLSGKSSGVIETDLIPKEDDNEGARESLAHQNT